MSMKKLVTDGFYRDEEGKWHIQPMKLPNCAKESAKKSSEKGKPTRKFIPIDRIKFTPVDSPPNSKRRKIDKMVRKELFKVPQRKSKGDRLSFSTRQSKNFNSNKPSNNRMSYKKTAIPKINIQLVNDGSPLLDIEEAEELLQNNNLNIKPPIASTNTIQGPNNNGSTPTKKDFLPETKTPESGGSDAEFINIEKALSTLNEMNKTDSPMSSVCALLENTKINNTVGNRTKKQNKTILTQIKTLIDQNQKDFENFCKTYQENTKKINDLLSLLEDDDENKENKKRRSSRIAAQVTISQEKSRYVISPAISKKLDLRRSTLNKNLTKSLQCEIQSPRMKKAVDLYNTMRNDYTVLCTPKLDRNAMDTHQTSVTRSLSRRIQKQCLLLQDTPKPGQHWK